MGSSSTTDLSLTDRFQILDAIGDGSFGSVSLARVKAAGEGVAGKRDSIVCVFWLK